MHIPIYFFISFSFKLCKSWLSCHNHHKKLSFFFPFSVPCGVDVHGLFCRWIVMDYFPDYNKLSCPSGSIHLCCTPTHVVGGLPAEYGQSLVFLFIKRRAGKWIPVKFLVLLCISLVMSKVEPLSLFRVWSVSPTRLSAPPVKSFADLIGGIHGLERFLGLLWAHKWLLNGAMNGWMNEWIYSALLSYWNQA